MKKIYTLIIILTSFIAARATHIRGGDISFSCLGKDTFKIRLVMYRDCTGIAYVSTVTMTVSPITGGNPGANNCPSSTLTMARISCRDVTPLCSSECKPCSQTSCNTQVSLCQQPIRSMGIEEVVYEGTLIFPKNINKKCCKFKVAYTIQARNGNITTGSAGEGFYSYAEIDRCVKPCFNSPIFKKPPVTILCRGKCHTLNMGVVDAGDHDSISYALSKPYQAEGSPADFNSPNSYLYPLSGYVPPANKGGNINKPWLKVKNQACSGFFLDSVFGDLIFKPTKIEQGPLCIDVKIWRFDSTLKKMVQIGLVRRDVQIIIQDTCPNEPPILSGPFVATVCSGEQICFSDMEVNDSDKTTYNGQTTQRDSTFVSYYGNLRNAIFTKKKVGKNEYWSLCWQTIDADASTTPYFFNIEAKDNFCPYPGISSRNYAIYVKKTPHDTRTYIQKTCDSIDLSATPIEKNVVWAAGYQYEWTVPYPSGNKYYTKDVRIALPPGKTVVKHMVEFSGCIDFAYDTIYMPEKLTLKLPADTTICQNTDYIIHTQKTNAKGLVKYYINQNPAAYEIDSFKVQVANDTMIYITAIDTLGCVAIDSINIHVQPYPTINLGPDKRICFGDSVTLYAGTNANSAVVQYEWRKISASTQLLFQTPSIRVGDSSTWSLQIIDSFKCPNNDTVSVYINLPVIVDAGPDAYICDGDTLAIKPQGAEKYIFIDANSGDTLATNTQQLLYRVTHSADIYVQGFTTSNYVTCFGADTIHIFKKPTPQLTLKAKRVCEDQTQINLLVTARDSAGKMMSGTGVWSTFDTILNKGLVGNTVNVKNVGATDTWPPNGDGRDVWCTFTASNGCVGKEVQSVIIDPLPPVSFAKLNICTNLPPFNLTGLGNPKTSFLDPNTETWKSKKDNNGNICNGCIYQDANYPNYWKFDPQKGVMGANLISYTYKDENGCINTYIDTFYIHPIPQINLNQPAPICNGDGIVDLWKLTNASPAEGVWMDDFNTKSGLQKGDSLTGLFDPTKIIPLNQIGGLPIKHKIIFMVRGNGCPMHDTIYLTIYPKPNITVPPDFSTCIDAAPWPLPSISSHSWWILANEDSATTNGRGNITPSALGLGKHTLTFHYIDPISGCRNEKEMYITILDTPSVSIQTAKAICEDESIQLNATIQNTVNITWSAAGTGKFTDTRSLQTIYYPSADEIADGKVYIHLESQNSNPCTERFDDAIIYINKRPTPNFNAQLRSGCSPLAVAFNYIGDSAKGSQYSWDFGDPSSSSFNESKLHSPEHLFINGSSEVKKYTIKITVTSAEGCDSILELKDYIEVYPLPHANFDPRPHKATVALPRIRFQNLSSNIDEQTKWHWSFGDAEGGQSVEKNPTYWYKNTDTGTYIVSLVATTQYGCIDSLEKPVSIGPEMTVFIPNAFTPDLYGPQKNNFFWVEADNYKGFEMYLFNRWGQEVFKSEQRLPGWNGMYQGKPAQEDVYVYQINIQNTDGRWFHFNGTVTLLR
jgi:gliding motility-associated-like protein